MSVSACKSSSEEGSVKILMKLKNNPKDNCIINKINFLLKQEPSFVRKDSGYALKVDYSCYKHLKLQALSADASTQVNVFPKPPRSKAPVACSFTFCTRTYYPHPPFSLKKVSSLPLGPVDQIHKLRLKIEYTENKQEKSLFCPVTVQAELRSGVIYELFLELESAKIPPKECVFSASLIEIEKPQRVQKQLPALKLTEEKSTEDSMSSEEVLDVALESKRDSGVPPESWEDLV